MREFLAHLDFCASCAALYPELFVSAVWRSLWQGSSEGSLRRCARSIFADLMLLCGVPALLAAKITVGVALTIGAAIIALGAVYFSVITIIVRSCPCPLRIVCHLRSGYDGQTINRTPCKCKYTRCFMGIKGLGLHR